MAKLIELTFDGGAQGVTATTANTANGADALTNMETTLTFDAASAHHGAMGLLTPATATSGYVYYDVSTKTLCVRFAFKMVSIPTSDYFLVRVGVGTTRYVSVHINSAGKLRVGDAAGTTGVWTAATALTAGQWYWGQLAIDSGTTSSNGTIKFDYYPLWSSTPVETGCNLAGTANAGSGVTFTRVYTAKYGAIAHQLKFDDLYIGNAAAYPGPYTPAASAAPKVLGGNLSNGGGWTIQGSGVYTEEQTVGQGSGDTTYLRSAGTGDNEEITLRLAPYDTGQIKVCVRMRQSPSSTATTARVTVLEGATARHTEVVTGLTSAFALYEIVLSPSETAAVVDRSALRVKIEGSAV